MSHVFWTYSPEHEGNFYTKVLKVTDGSDAFHAAQLASLIDWMHVFKQHGWGGCFFFDSCDNIRKKKNIFCSIVACMSIVALIDILDQNVVHV